MLKPIDSQVSFPEVENEVLKFWKKNKIFEKSVEMRSGEKKWTFLDGPPFVTGMPHYGSLLPSLAKDLFGRYYTMKGYKVRRVWGWDGHGLPIENKVEGKLKIKRKRDIEEVIGVKKFIDECLKYVDDVTSEWEWYVDRIGRWVDFKNAYKTWDSPYMESVMWVFKQMYDKGHIYKGLRVSLYCPHCSTPISNFEVAMDADNYRDVTESATTYKYKISDKTYILAWSTTPWNKIATLALAVNPGLDYVKVKVGDEFYILAKSTLKILGDKYKIFESFKGDKLIGMKFEPHYDYFKIAEGKKAFEVIGGEFVTADEGTGIVTIAAYGEEDLKVMMEQNIHIETHVDDEGMIKENVPKFSGLYYLDANKAVNDDLASRGLIFSDKPYTHSVAFCWRCATRLFYNPQNAWYVNIQNLKDKLIQTNKEVNWFPNHFKEGRFQKSIENAPDWNISRSRYWGSPVPVWECECGERFVPGSIKELEERSGSAVHTLHKPDIDELTIKCTKCDRNVKRVPEVLDSWIEAGSASFAERHFPFNEKEKLEDFYPPDYIAEYTGQIRAWFYVLHVISNALYDSKGFKNVNVTGVILGTDGRKMSKNYGNYPDPRKLIETYGGDALRMYLLGSPVMNGEDIRISEADYKNQVRGTLLILWNVYNFFLTYAQIDGWSPKINSSSENALDKWIISRLNKTVKSMSFSLDSFNTADAIDEYKKFVNELSTWYLRRSRSRVGGSADDEKDKNSFYSTIYEVLITLSKISAPITPFISESIFKNLTDKESVHLEDWPVSIETEINETLENDMVKAQNLSSIISSFRKESGVKVKIPFIKLKYDGPAEIDEEILKIVKDETNIEELEYGNKKGEFEVNGEIGESNQNVKAGDARDIIRKIQQERKVLKTTMTQMVNVALPDWPQEYENEIRKKALVQNLSKGVNFKVEVV